jgi:hypothetical protein
MYILQHYITKYEIRNRDDMHSNKSDIISRKRDDINANRNFATQILRNELSLICKKKPRVINLPGRWRTSEK